MRQALASRQFVRGSIVAVLVLLAVAAGALAGLAVVYSVGLPQVSELERDRPNTTTELYDVHGRLFGSFPLRRQAPVAYADFSPLLRQAILAVEDKNFKGHWGAIRAAAAVYRDLASSENSPPPSSLTMQLARSLFPSGGRNFGRKLQESLLAMQIERRFSRQQIFTLYANQAYLGHGVYGFEAGAQRCFSKHARDLTLPEAALLGGLPQPSAANSLLDDPDKAFRRRNIVINAMLEEGAITTRQAAEARATPLGLRIQPTGSGTAPWFVEWVRDELEDQFGPEQIHESNLRVYTTLDLDLQQAANRAVLDGLAVYERRRGWRARLLNVTAAGVSVDAFQHPDWADEVAPGGYTHAVVVGVLPYQVTARVGHDEVLLTPEDWGWTGISAAERLVRPGDIIYVHLAPAARPAGAPFHGTLEQDSGAEGALLAIDNASGEVLAMVGGRDFNMSQYNRATEAERQAGSSFMPIVYAAAVEQGATPEQTVEDVPGNIGGFAPRNADGRYLGKISLLRAFTDSRNVPAVRLAARVGMAKVADVARRFGIAAGIPPHLPMALGTVEMTLQEQVAAYAAFPNDGVRTAPHVVRRVATADGATLWQASAQVEDATSAKAARAMIPFFREATRSGTGAAAALLKHPVGGKTGTSLDFTNAWFVGFSPSVTCGVWVGFDDRQPLGEGETGARTALPIWMDFMGAAVAGKGDEAFSGDPK